MGQAPPPDDDDDESRPTTAINPGELRELVAEARTDARATDGIAPIVMIVDRPKELAPNSQREIATRMMQPIELHSLGHAPVVAEPPKPRPAVFDRRPTGVALEEARRMSWRPWLLAACLIASVLLLLL